MSQAKYAGFGFLGIALLAAPPALALTGAEVLKKMDAAEYSAQDTDATVKLVMTDKGGARSERKMQMFQKGMKQRLVRFLEPADVKGIGFLDEGDDKMYLYLPALHKVRRIAGHVKNENFAGTDFAFQDLQAGEFSERVDAKSLTEDDAHYIVEAVPRPGTDSKYGKLILHIRKSDFLFDKIEFFDESQTLWKLFTRDDFRPVGKYTQSYRVLMKDLKAEHSTEMTVLDLKVDVGLKDSFFSQRQLKK
jgi:outer membrane lipoprotein-sorting protein